MAGLQSVLQSLQGEKENVEERFGSEVAILREQLLTEQGQKEKLELSLARQLEAARKEIGVWVGVYMPDISATTGKMYLAMKNTLFTH